MKAKTRAIMHKDDSCHMYGEPSHAALKALWEAVRSRRRGNDSE